MQIHLLHIISTTCTRLLSALSVGLWSMVVLWYHDDHDHDDHDYERRWELRRPVLQTFAASLSDICKFIMGLCKLWVFFRELLVSFEANSVSSYFDRLLEHRWGSWYFAVASSTWDSSKLVSAPSEGHVSISIHIFTVLCPYSPVTRTNPT
jgi:hypothetical protein